MRTESIRARGLFFNLLAGLAYTIEPLGVEASQNGKRSDPMLTNREVGSGSLLVKGARQSKRKY